MNNSSSDDEIFENSEYYIKNYNDICDNYSSTDESENETENEIEQETEHEHKNNILNLEDEQNFNDNEVILTLSSKKIIQENKIIHFKKIMLNVITNNNFTTNEILIIHSIYNYNKHLLLQRNKILNEFILINIILNHFNIIILNNTTKILPEIPWNKNNKKYKNNYKEIISNYDFKKFIKNNKCEKVNFNSTKNLIKGIINGFVFYIKNLILLNKEIFVNIKEEELNDFINIIIKNTESIFCKDEKLQIISDWLCNILKRILIFNFSKFILQKDESVLFKKILEEEVYIILNIIFYLIIILNNEKKINKYGINNEKLKLFLIYNYKNTLIEEILENKIFKIIIEYIYKNKNKKIFLCKKKYLKFLNDNFF